MLAILATSTPLKRLLNTSACFRQKYQARMSRQV